MLAGTCLGAQRTGIEFCGGTPVSAMAQSPRSDRRASDVRQKETDRGLSAAGRRLNRSSGNHGR